MNSEWALTVVTAALRRVVFVAIVELPLFTSIHPVICRELVSERQGRLEDTERHATELDATRKSREQLSRRFGIDRAEKAEQVEKIMR